VLTGIIIAKCLRDKENVIRILAGWLLTAQNHAMPVIYEMQKFVAKGFSFFYGLRMSMIWNQLLFNFPTYLNRSSLNISTEPIYMPGDMNRMFENIPVEFAHYGVNIISTSPWIVIFDNFLTDEEVQALISTNEGNWERSTDSGVANEYVHVTDFVISAFHHLTTITLRLQPPPPSPSSCAYHHKHIFYTLCNHHTTIRI